MEYIIETEGLTKRYGKRLCVNNISIHIAKGDIYGFIGRNGAGKTTAMRLILGLARPTSGKIKLFNSDDLNAQRKKIGSLIEAPGLYKRCSALENMKRFSILYGGDDKEIEELLSFVGLNGVGNKKVGQFSLGMKQRLGIAIALLGNPEVLILDEPVNGLDPAGIKEVRDLLLKLNKEKNVTIMISSHLLDELAKITTKYGIINNGVLVEEIDAQKLMERCKNNIVISCDRLQEAKELLESELKLTNISIVNDKLHIVDEIESTDEINTLLVKNDFKVHEITINKNSFEDYFIERLGR
ncbi:MAG TPA: bacitracin ABC transporter ATP-binding protein [Firmicutes bacterium]|nr:aBC transporter ATP-binding protein [Clostridium sp. CAG:288]HAR48061.1 bacitracin ABC transporter ATP-binding protein [Bacillota bacterium]HAW99872.1 bacitracin ABC transporter ATP-binding protein [Bacillota bacterium]